MDESQRPVGMYFFVHIQTGNSEHALDLLYFVRALTGLDEDEDFLSLSATPLVQLWRVRKVQGPDSRAAAQYELDEPCPLHLETLVIGVEYMNRALLKLEPWSGFSWCHPISTERLLKRGDLVPAAEILGQGEPWFVKEEKVTSARRVFTTLYPKHHLDPLEEELRGIVW